MSQKQKSPNPKTEEKQKLKLFVVERKGGELVLDRCDVRSAFSRLINISPEDAACLNVGDIVRAALVSKHNAETAKDIEFVGNVNDKDILNYVTAMEADLPVEYDRVTGIKTVFSQAALKEAAEARVPSFEELEGYEDLRNIPLMTIDPKTAKDFDDAVYATPRAEGGYHLITAIAGVAHYVKPGSALDKEAMTRGNTTYLPGIAIPMLPEKLSDNLCSLVPHQERLCMAYHVDVDAEGEIVGGYAKPAMMKSVARLHYGQVQEAFDGNPDEVTAPIMAEIKMLYAASDTMEKAKEKRDVLNIEKTEYTVVFNDAGQPADIDVYPKYKSNKVIENFALVTNNWTGNALSVKGTGIYRIHEKPEKLDKLAEILSTYGVSLSGSGEGETITAEDISTPKMLNKALDEMKKIQDGPELEEVKVAVLQSMNRAFYGSEAEVGHFGLQLEHYTHTTSPIRRAPDIIATRMLIKQFNLSGKGITDEDLSNLQDVSANCSATERNSDDAEKAAMQRFTAKVFEQHIGKKFDAEVRHIGKSGVLVRLDNKDVEAVIPIKFVSDTARIAVNNKVRSVVDGNSENSLFSRGDKINVVVYKSKAINGRIVCKVVANDNEANKQTKHEKKKAIKHKLAF